MKLTLVILATFILQIRASTFAQYVTLKETNKNLRNIFSQIRKQTGYVVLYESSIVNRAAVISVNLEKTPINEALKIILKDQKLDFEIKQKSIILSRQKVLPERIIEKSEKIDIKGKIIDVNGKPIPNVNILIKGTKRGVSTDVDGNFSLTLATGENEITISAIGFETQTVAVNNRTFISITLKEMSANLDEFVVVGYGTQKKINLSGSVSSVSGKTITERPVPSIANLLQGRISGLDIVQPTGEPGRDNGSFRLRGLGSYGASSAPLVLVDGIIGSINNLSPQDVENVTVLKDASSASIYGARAANGVILVTTKKGKLGTDVIEYNGSYGISEATRMPDLITNSVTYMEMYNQAKARSGQPAQYTQAQIDAYRNNPNNEQYPNFNWLEYILGKGPIHNHNLGFSGGTTKSTYNVSLNYLDQNSITKGYLYKRYNGLLDFSTQVHSRVKIGANINMSFQDLKAPWLVNDDLLLLAYAAAPTFKPFLPDGSGRIATRDYVSSGGTNRTPEEVYNTGSQFTKNYNVNAQGYIDINIIKGLNWLSKGAITFFNQDFRNRQFRSPSFAYQPNAAGVYQEVGNGNSNFAGLQQSSARNITKTFYSTLNYNKVFANNHNFGVLAGYEQQDNRSTNLSGGRFDFPNSTIMELDGSSPLNQTLGGNSFEWALQSLFGRVNYNYKEKYILEGNIRHDGTSRVDERYRWGTFGGGSAAWKISEESFIKDNFSWIDNLKIRASYGVLGNQEIVTNGNLNYYPYQDILSLTTYPFSSLSSGVQLTRLVEKNLRWEKTSVRDIGLEFDLYKGLFGATINYYRKNTTDILATRTDLPTSFGLAAPTVNAGAMVNKGIEIELRHQNRIGDFTYGANFIFHRYRNKVTKVITETLGTFEVGQPFNNFFVYDWIGVFQSQQEIDSSPKQPNSGVLKPGDLKIRDVSGNGTVGPEDRIRISSFPDYTYSFSLNAGWKGFNLSAFFQGVEGQKVNVSQWGYEPFMQGSAPPTKFLNAWTPTNPSNTIPAVYLTGYAGVAGYNSTYFLQDASYLRLKNLYLSYTLPDNISKKIGSSGVTVYTSGDNLITWTKYEGNDPERAGSGRFAQFPQIRIYTIGLKVKY
ncbi:TonB-dependent receptor [Pedobacter ghigonis]|uniref:TonB-dependent receptor n=1 Tax=Pedobacter ghigonis TaxID=2730403 RepID=UPI00158D9B32|nr:TonB-dependent receptor [Pedobacter ghigonis]